jgi:hypothetical protein
MIDRARWILLGTAIALLAVAFAWSCGGGGNSGIPCGFSTLGITEACGTPAPPGANLQKISICPGTPPSPTPVPSSSVSTSPTPIETTCAGPIATTVPVAGTVQFHAVGTYNTGATQDITDSSSTNWTTTNSAVVMPNTSPAGSYFATGVGSAQINASSGGVTGSPPAVVSVFATPTATPTP